MIKKWPWSLIHTYLHKINQLSAATNFQVTGFNSSRKIHCFHFFPKKSLSYQIWSCRKISQGHSRVIIWINYDGLESLMLHTKFRGNRPTGSGEDFWRVFTKWGRDGHLGHVTSIMSSDFRFLVPEIFHKKFGSDWHSSFWEILVWNFVCTRPWAKVKKWPWPSILIYLHIFNKMSAPTNFQVTGCNGFCKSTVILFPIEKPKLPNLTLP